MPPYEPELYEGPTRAEFQMLYTEVKETKMSVGGLYGKIDEIRTCVSDACTRADFEAYKEAHRIEHNEMSRRLSPVVVLLITLLSSAVVGLAVALVARL